MKYPLRQLVSVVGALWTFAAWSPMAGSAAALQWGSRGSEADNEPIRYSSSTPSDVIARLEQDVDSGKAALRFEVGSGYLASLLHALNIRPSSQMLVFSKTSFQRERISPAHPRAVYFGENVYVGAVPGSPMLEIASIDPQLGTVFYTLRQDGSAPPSFQRQTRQCLQCHESTLTAGVPGLIMTSVHPDADGAPILPAGTYSTTDQSPLSERWGGWFVSGTTGSQAHLGVALDRTRDLSSYLTPHSDVVALTVFAHQTRVQNLITRLNYSARMALNFDRLRSRDLGRPADYVSPETTAIIRTEGEPLVQAMLMAGEAPLTDPVAGSSAFTAEFAAQGPRDQAGRSLRDLDLHTRLFRYPCSYLIYSASFDALPLPAKQFVYARLWSVLSGDDPSPVFRHLSPADRQAIADILTATKSDFSKD